MNPVLRMYALDASNLQDYLRISIVNTIRQGKLVTAEEMAVLRHVARGCGWEEGENEGVRMGGR